MVRGRVVVLQSLARVLLARRRRGRHVAQELRRTEERFKNGWALTRIHGSGEWSWS